VEDTLSEWSRPSFDPSTDVRLVFDRDRLVGYAEVFGARKAWSYVHPSHRGRGIGAALVDWTERYARDAGGRLVGQSISENEIAARDLFLSRGYGVLWNSWILEKELGREEALPVLSGGLRLRNFEPGKDDLRVYRVVEDAFNEWPDRDPTPFEDWRAMTLARPDFDPGLVFVVEDGEDIVGMAYCIEDRGTWWVQQLAVRASHRRRGLGRALLQQAFHRARRRGLHRVGLSTDSRTGALGLYEHVGMHLKRTYTHYAKPL
jgi:GNAT superfamily N-acetyltransferase